jgi:hypothetical protein
MKGIIVTPKQKEYGDHIVIQELATGDLIFNVVQGSKISNMQLPKSELKRIYDFIGEHLKIPEHNIEMKNSAEKAMCKQTNDIQEAHIRINRLRSLVDENRKDANDILLDIYERLSILEKN